MQETEDRPLDRHVVSVGGTRSISLGKVIPPDWRYVRIYSRRVSENTIELRIEKLLSVEEYAQALRSEEESR
ncbi:MAG: hypothetical protein JRE40_03375 [Deltaproteobacteria bacterium]|nr:hypothetical protein [Deltaproteobacteria bacterium]MBW2672985.1 hypothetical protein [Deltaproteobacteria bacterium]